MRLCRSNSIIPARPNSRDKKLQLVIMLRVFGIVVSFS